LPVATAALAVGIFIADILAPPDVVVAGLYILVVLMASRFCRPPRVVLVAAGCIGLVVLAYFLSTETAINAAIRIPAIGAATFLAVERHRATEALHRGEEHWREVFEHNPVMYFIVSPTGTVLSVNSFGAAQLGYTTAELIGQSVLKVFFEKDQEAVKDQLATCVEEFGRPRSWEIQKIRKDGTVLWVRENAKAVHPLGSGVTVLIACEDITERRHSEAALRASEERWRAMVETAPIGIVTFGSEHRRYVTANKSFQQITGYTEDELRNLTPLEITHEDDRERLRKHVDRIVAGLQRRYRIEKRYRSKHGEIVWADISTFVVRATDNTPAFLGAVAVDITDRKRAEDALQQAQGDLARLNRVMLLGEMTASIAHEVNQPIAAVITNANAGLRWLGGAPPDLDEVRQALGRIVRDGTRAGEVIDRIRALVKKVPPRRDLLEINEAICEVIALTRTEMQRNDVSLQSRLADDLPLVSADRIQLQQVMINLIVNAIEAMSGVAGRPRELTIVSGTDHMAEVLVEVTDTGPGLDPDTLDRLFQSFYTTKPDGIGMGLAISRSIVEAHGGQLSAALNNPRGAVFRLTLPVEETVSRSAGRSRH
jgi:PAS domain S-box-containing protein